MKVKWQTLLLSAIIGALVAHYMIVPYLKEQDWWPKKQSTKVEIRLPNLEIRK